MPGQSRTTHPLRTLHLVVPVADEPCIPQEGKTVVFSQNVVSTGNRPPAVDQAWRGRRIQKALGSHKWTPYWYPGSPTTEQINPLGRVVRRGWELRADGQEPVYVGVTLLDRIREQFPDSINWEQRNGTAAP